VLNVRRQRSGLSRRQLLSAEVHMHRHRGALHESQIDRDTQKHPRRDVGTVRIVFFFLVFFELTFVSVCPRRRDNNSFSPQIPGRERDHFD